MNVKLISITNPSIELVYTAEDLIVYTARVSNPSNQMNFETSEKLLKYMVDNAHWSPFEMCDMTVEIVTSRAIAHQIIRHRSFSFQEFSQRYSKQTKIENIQLRKKAETNRQSSVEELNDKENFELSIRIENIINKSIDLYNEMIEKGVSKECARFILPEATQSVLYMKGSVRSWIHYFKVRCDEHTQLEHQEVANKIKDIFSEQFPIISKLLCLNQ